jgi:uncharacterized protein
VAHVSLITLGVSDLDRSTAFYEALGWQRSSASVAGEVTFLRGGTVALALWGRDALAADAGVPVTGAPGPIALAVNLPDPASVDALLGAAAGAGGRVTKPAERTDWGGYSGYLADPDGHLWEVAHNPHWPLDGDGRIDLPR